MKEIALFWVSDVAAHITWRCCLFIRARRSPHAVRNDLEVGWGSQIFPCFLCAWKLFVSLNLLVKLAIVQDV